MTRPEFEAQESGSRYPDQHFENLSPSPKRGIRKGASDLEVIHKSLSSRLEVIAVTVVHNICMFSPIEPEWFLSTYNISRAVVTNKAPY